jgi:hypothetical protein
MGKFDGYREGGKDAAGEEIEAIVGISEHLAVYLVPEYAIKIDSDRAGAPTEWESRVHRRYECLLTRIGRVIPRKKSRPLLGALASSLFNALSVAGEGQRLDDFFGGVADDVKQRAREYSRTWYLVGCVAAMAPLAAFAYTAYCSNFTAAAINPLFFGLAGGALGAVLSVLRRSSRLRVDEYAHRYFQGLQGAVRVLLGVVFGLLLVIGIKAGFVFTVFAENPYAVFLLAAVAGHSENLVPELMARWEAQGDAQAKTPDDSDSTR